MHLPACAGVTYLILKALAYKLSLPVVADLVVALKASLPWLPL